MFYLDRGFLANELHCKMSARKSLRSSSVRLEKNIIEITGLSRTKSLCRLHTRIRGPLTHSPKTCTEGYKCQWCPLTKSWSLQYCSRRPRNKRLPTLYHTAGSKYYVNPSAFDSDKRMACAPGGERNSLHSKLANSLATFNRSLSYHMIKV